MKSPLTFLLFYLISTFAVGQTTEAVDYCNLQFPAISTTGAPITVYARVYEGGITPGTGQGSGINAWIGLSETNSDPDTWTIWIPAIYNAGYVDPSNDEYQATIGDGLSAGVYYYASRFQIEGSSEYRYGGTSGFWDGSLSISGELTLVSSTNSAPTGITISQNSIEENVSASSIVDILESIDGAFNTHSYTLVSGTGSTDNENFDIDGDQLEISISPDFETKSSYSIRIQTTDQDDLSYEEAFTITINDINESPFDITLPENDVDENVASGTAVGILSSDDPDDGNTHSYALVSGTGSTDNEDFNIDGDQLEISISPDFETKSSYSIRIQTTDQDDLSYEEAFTITINDINDDPSISDQAFSIDENSDNGTVIGNVLATDSDDDELTYSITSGNGDNTFAIESSTGELTIADNNMLDFEINPSFSLTVAVDDGNTGTVSATITINVSDVEESTNTDPSISDQAFSIDENSDNGTIIGTVVATDSDDDELTYSITSGNGDNTFAIESSTGELTIADNSLLDFEINPIFNLVVSVDDGNGSNAAATVTIEVNDIDENVLGLEGSIAIKIYPNPVIDGFMLSGLNFTPSDRLILFSMSGRKVKELIPHGIQRFVISELESGTYILMIEENNSRYSIGRIIKR